MAARSSQSDQIDSESPLPQGLKDEVQTPRRCVELEARLIDDPLDLTRIIRPKLALSLSNAFMEAQGGSIAASSSGPGKGSTSIVSIPVVPPPAQETPSPPVTREPVGGGRSLQILLVEDHDDTARVLSRLLERLGHRVRIAGSVATALAAADQPFDLLLSDIGLPDGTGNDLIRQLRNDRHINVPAIALTGFGMEEDIAKSREAGFTDHLTKPVNFQRLQMMVQKIADG